MRFGKIDYLNLLPFEVFIHSYPAPSHFKLFYRKKKSYPSKLNQEFLFGRIDAGFVSSILASNPNQFYASKIGIVAKKEVISVICLPKKSGEDYQSNTSNALLKVLKIKGGVLIGDRALREVLRQKVLGQKDYIDMAQLWVKKQNLPFVFGRLCIKKHRDFFEKLIAAFAKKPIKIPQYLLQDASKKSKIEAKEILKYLQVLSYKIDNKASLGVKRFYRELRLAGIKPPKRF